MFKCMQLYNLSQHLCLMPYLLYVLSMLISLKHTSALFNVEKSHRKAICSIWVSVILSNIKSDCGVKGMYNLYKNCHFKPVLLLEPILITISSWISLTCTHICVRAHTWLLCPFLFVPSIPPSLCSPSVSSESCLSISIRGSGVPWSKTICCNLSVCYRPYLRAGASRAGAMAPCSGADKVSEFSDDEC